MRNIAEALHAVGVLLAAAALILLSCVVAPFAWLAVKMGWLEK